MTELPDDYQPSTIHAQPVGLGVAAVLVIIASLASLVAGLAWFQHSQLESQRELHGERMQKIEEQVQRVVTRMEKDDVRERLDHGIIKELQANARSASDAEQFEKQAIRELEKWAAKHDYEVRGTNAEQYERIKSLERETFGRPSGNGDQP